MKVSVSGADLFYSTGGGRGPTCLFLCNLGTGVYERMTPPSLAEQLRFVYVDLRGTGQSTGDPTELTFDRVADDLDAVRAHLGVERIAVLGYSMLGTIAIEYGRRRPQSVSHVIGAGAAPIGNMAQLSAKAAAFFEQDASEERKRIVREKISQLSPGAPPGQAVLAQTPMRFFDPHVDAAALFAGASTSTKFLQHMMATVLPSWDITRQSDSLRVPILLAHGRYDYVVPHVLWRDVAPKLPNATLRIFERSGHQPFFEEPDPFAATLTEWMKGTAPA